MPIIRVPNNVSPKQIEFEEGIERSKPGALYFTPGSVKTITKDELEYLRKKHKHFASRLVIVSEKDVDSRLKMERQKNLTIDTTVKPKDKISTHKRKQAALLAASSLNVESVDLGDSLNSKVIIDETISDSTNTIKKNTSKKK